MSRFYNSYSRFEKTGLEYPQNDYDLSTIKVKVIKWGPKWEPTSEIRWEVDGIPYITWRKLYQRKNGSYYCEFMNKRISVEFPKE